MKTLCYTLAAAGALIASPALAQDGDSFSGFYVGAYAGYDHIKVKEATSGISESKDGIAFGAIAGYDLNIGGAVAGVEGEFGDASTQKDFPDLFVSGDNFRIAANRDLYIGGRLGVRAAQNILVYAKAGYTNTRFKGIYDDGAGTIVSESDNLDGFRLGGGVQYDMGRLGLRLEYRYSDYGDFVYQGVNTGLSTKRHQVVVVAVGKF